MTNLIIFLAITKKINTNFCGYDLFRNSSVWDTSRSIQESVFGTRRSSQTNTDGTVEVCVCGGGGGGGGRFMGAKIVIVVYYCGAIGTSLAALMHVKAIRACPSER